MDQEKKGIPFDQFKLYCTSGHEYTGDVQDFGYVYWLKKRVPVELPDDLPINAPFKTTYVTVSNLYVMRNPSPYLFYGGIGLTDEQKKEQEKAVADSNRFGQFMATLLTAVNVANSVYGNVKTFQSMSTVPVTLGAKYLQVNKGGTLVRNLNRTYTTEGEIASKLGRKIFFAGVVIDAALVGFGKQTINDALINTAVNGGILIIGSFCPPLGVVLGVAYLAITLFAPDSYYSTESYEKIHGSIAPADNTRVHNPNKR